MNTTKLFFASFFIFIFFACQENKPETNDRKKSNNDLEGSWTLVNVSGGFAGINNNFQLGWILWRFNPTTQLLSVENNNPMENPLHDGFETGNYSFSTTTTPSRCQNNFQSLKVGEFYERCYRISNNELIINDNIAADGFQYKFIRFVKCGKPSN